MIMKSIVYATDGSKSAEHASEMVKEYLEAWPEMELYVLYVTDREKYAYDYVPDAVDHYEERITNEIKETIEHNIFGNWKNRGRGFFDRALLGSVAHGVLNRYELPVLVVR